MIIMYSGWWMTYPSEKYEFVKWDSVVPKYDGKNKIHVPNHQPDWVGVSQKYRSFQFKVAILRG